MWFGDISKRLTAADGGVRSCHGGAVLHAVGCSNTYSNGFGVFTGSLLDAKLRSQWNGSESETIVLGEGVMPGAPKIESNPHVEQYSWQLLHSLPFSVLF